MNIKRPLQSIAVLCSCAALLLYGYGGHAYGFSVVETNGGALVHWPTPQAGYYINTSGFPSASLQAVQAAMQTWTNVATSNFNFMYKGVTSSTAYGINDGANLICLGSLGDEYNATLALNTFWFTAQGHLLDSDIKFNETFIWATDGSSGAYDVQTIALHELGHALSLEDLYDAGQEPMAMFYRLSAGEIKRALHQDDKNGITYLYNGSGSTTSSTTTVPSPPTDTGGQCPAQQAMGEDNPDIARLRAFRDGTLAQSAVGRELIRIYYNNAESINAALDRSPALRAAARKFFEAAASLVENSE